MDLDSKTFIDELLNIPRIFSGIRAIDNQNIALTIYGLNPNVDVFLLEYKGEDKKLKILTETEEVTYFTRWWPDSKSLVVAEDKARNERIALYRVFLDEPKKMNPLTKETPDYYLRGSEIAPKGNFIYYFANFDPQTKKETEIFHLYAQNVENKEEIDHLTSAVKPAWNQAQLNLKGSKLLYSRSDIDPAGKQYWLINVDGEDDREILNFGKKAKLEASWLPDSKNIVFVTDSYNNNRLNKRLVGIYSIETEKLTWILNSPEDSQRKYDFSKAYVSRFDPDTLVLREIINAKQSSYFYKLNDRTLVPFPRFEAGTLLPSYPIESGKWVGSYYSSIQPETLVSFPIDNIPDLTSDRIEILYDNFAQLKIKKSHLTQAKEIEWTSSDNESIHGWLYIPTKPSNKGIVYVHGGPTAHSEDALNEEIQYYASRGFAVLDPNYRGSTGYGVKFRELIKESGWGSNEQEDIAMGARALVKRGLVEDKKIGITGTSYGGFSAWHGITKFPKIFMASVPVCGMTDLIVDYETTRPDIRPYSEEMMGGSPEEVPERYKEGSPINYIQNITGKVLIVQGMNDPNVTPENVEVVERELKKYNIEYKKLPFDDEGHGIFRKKNRRVKISKICEFFENNL
ncbi:MAG: prolyl oligopeptidase family serine peptidase [Candidatus Hodarchaeales archaeon]|jgi:dipeptidyl aminopeptidase/acylaminoacyl peptidase